MRSLLAPSELAGPGTTSAGGAMNVRTYPDIDTLPSRYSGLFEALAENGIFYSRPWLENWVANIIAEGETLRLYGVEQEGPEALPRALLAGTTSQLYATHVRARVLRFQQLDGMPLTPFFTPTDGNLMEVLEPLVARVYAAEPPYDVVRFSPMDSRSVLLAELVRVLRAAGQVVQTFHYFTSRYEITDAMSWQDYLEARPSMLRNTLRRKGKKLEASGRSRFELITGGAELERAVHDYDKVLAASWKEGEAILPVGYMRGTIACAAEAGALRLGLIYLDDEPVATQFWIVSAGVAHNIRLAYDQLHRALSVGSLLTERMIRHFIEVDHVRAVDLGIGDDSYKKDWAGKRRELMGIAAFNPRTPRGLKGIVRHVGGRAIKRLLVGLIKPLSRVVPRV